MRYAYPCLLEADETGALTATFRDVPEAITGGDTRQEALVMAADALAVALGGYVHDRRDIPAPTKPVNGETLVAVSPVVAAKLALYSAMRMEGITKVEMAGRLGVSEAAVRKLLDPDHRSHIGQVETALRAVGRRLIVEDAAA